MKMKNKIFKTLTALLAALVCMGGFSIPAYAQGNGDPDTDIPTDDSGVQFEEEEKTPPLTPDGNATLVDDFGGNKQLITVTTKNGNYFYILIDRDDEGENTVHFLNQVDEADLMALMEDENSNAATPAEPPAVCNCTDKCEAGKVNTYCPVCAINMTGCNGTAPEPEPEELTEQPKEKSGGTGGLALFLIVALLGGGGAFYYIKFIKPKQGVKVSGDFEDFDFDEYDEDEPETDTPDQETGDTENEQEDEE